MPRTVITTDPELDDLNSMLRLLLYSNEINIAGLIYSSSMVHHKGDTALGIDNGLRNWQDPRWGGWGGRQIVDPADPKRWSNKGALDATPEGTTANDYSSARFFSAIQNDFAARLKWSVTSDPTGANHHPKASVAEGLDLIRHPGEIVTLHGRASHPDGNAVTLKWWQYQEAGTYPSTVRLSAIDDNSTAFQIPRDAEPGQTIHVILEAKDNGSPALTHYQRVVITVADPRLHL
jgi:hypothetical protein